MSTKFLILFYLMFVSGSSKLENPEYEKRAHEMFDLVWNNYRVHHHQLFSEYFPNSYKPDLTYFQDSAKQTMEVSYLWPMSGVFSSVNILMEIDSVKYKPYLDSMVIAVEEYLDTSRVPSGYQAYPVDLGYSDRYYDDNALVGIDYIDAYRVTGNKQYLEKAKTVMRFILSGWSDDYGGGVSWLEGIRDQKPACSNGKATVFALKLFDATRDSSYLKQGCNFFDWTMNTLMDDSLGIIWNSLLIREDTAFVQKHAYTYNTGTMIQSACRLYNITKDKSYLLQAQSLASASYDFYFHFTKQDIPYIDDLPWFNVVLFRGYQELYELDGNPKYINALKKSADWAWNHARNEDGFIGKDWTGRINESKRPKWLLDEACTIEMFARMALLNKQ